MLKRLLPEDVTLGMYVAGFEGSWLKHPFWRSGFLLSSPADVEKVRSSEIAAVIVDVAKGAAPAAPPVAIAPAKPRRPTAPPAASSAVAKPRRSIAPTPPAGEERARAAVTIRKSKRAVMRMFGEARLGRAIDIAAVAPLVDEIADSVGRDAQMLIGMARMKRKDEYTYMHSIAVCALMINLARHLALDEAIVREAGMAGLLHDIGKMAIPQAMLDKPSALDDAEFAIMRGHPELGHRLLSANDGVPADVLDVCLHHHEKIDGSGYPHGLAGERIGLLARMGAICDVYDAITSNRPYKKGWQPADSLARMLSWHGHFDPALLAAFVRSIGIHPAGQLVRLRSNRLAIVLGDKCADPTCPRVRVFYSIMERAEIEPVDLVVTTSLKGDQIVSYEDPIRWSLPDWTERSAALLALDMAVSVRRSSEAPRNSRDRSRRRLRPR